MAGITSADQTPIFDRVCTNYEMQIVGYRTADQGNAQLQYDLTDKYLGMFSHFDRDAYLIPPGATLPYIQAPHDDPPPDDPPFIPLASGWLFFICGLLVLVALVRSKLRS